jgi:predicted PurR-regulated permease PerM
MPPTAQPTDEIRFLRRVLIVAGVVALILFLWAARAILLVGFGAVLVALLLDSAAGLLCGRFGLSRRTALLAAGAGILALLALASWLVGSSVSAQLSQLGEALPRAVAALERRFGIDIPEGAAAVPDGMLGSIAGFGRGLLDATAALLLAVVGGSFLVSDPARYRAGFVKLFPRDQAARVEDMLDTLGNALRRWLLAALVAMVIVGVAAGLACWAIGLPAPLALGLFAGLAQFVPVVGAILGAVPALLLAMSVGGSALLWTAVAFLVIQQVESNMITPIVEERLVNIPAFVLLLGIMAAGAVFGPAGLALAAPLTVVAFVAVQKLYVRETLGRSVEVAGEE